MNSHECSYELKKEIYERVEKRKLDNIYETSINFKPATQCVQEKNKSLQNEKNSFSFDGNNISKQQNLFEDKTTEKISGHNYFAHLKNSKFQSKYEANYKENLQESNIKNFKHMKSILGHISTVDDNIINPVAIYCICYSNDNELIFTGDNNGYEIIPYLIFKI